MVVNNHAGKKVIMEEIWKKYKDTVYEVSTYGRVRNTRTGNILHEQNVYRGVYKSVHLWLNGKDTYLRVHRLVAETFIPNPENKRTVNHIDCDPSNNRVDNLEWSTDKEQYEYGKSLGHQSAFLKQQHNQQRRKIKATNIKTKEEILFDSTQEAYRYFGTKNFFKVLKGLRKQAHGYTFEYLKGGDAYANHR